MKKIIFAIILITCLSFTNQAFAKPTSPTSVNVNPAPDGSSVKISWGNVAAADNYLIQRTTDSPSMGVPSWTDIGSSNSLSYTDNSVASDNSYWYSVIAVDTDDPMDQFSNPIISSRVDVPSLPGPGGPPGGGPGASGSSGLFPVVQCGNEGQAPCTLCDIFETISRLMRIIILFSFAIGGGLIVVSGIMMYFGGSNPGLLKTAKTILKNVIIGIIIMLLSYLIVFTIIHVLSGGSADTYFNLKSGGFVIECKS